jgi:hypothetical protein
MKVSEWAAWIAVVTAAGGIATGLYRGGRWVLNRYELLPFRGYPRPPLMLVSNAARILSEKNPRRAKAHRDHGTSPVDGIATDIFRYAEAGRIPLYGKRAASKIPERIYNETLDLGRFRPPDCFDPDGANWVDLSVNRFHLRKISKWIDLGAITSSRH